MTAFQVPLEVPLLEHNRHQSDTGSDENDEPVFLIDECHCDAVCKNKQALVVAFNQLLNSSQVACTDLPDMFMLFGSKEE